MNIEQKNQTLHMLATILEMNSQEMSPAAMAMITAELSVYDFDAIQAAMRKTAKQGYKVTLGRIVENIDDGRPDPELAWKQVEHLTEYDAAVLTVEQHRAFCMVSTSLESGGNSERITARQAFLAEYKRMCGESRDQCRPVQYMLTRAMGDPDGQKANEVVTKAVQEGKLPENQAAGLLPDNSNPALESHAEKEHAKMIANLVKVVADKKIDGA